MSDVTATRGARRVAGALLVLLLIAGVANLWATDVSVHSSAAAQKRASGIIEQKLCRTFREMAARTPPPGSPQGSPSRAYLQEQHATLDEIPGDLGCPSR